MEVGFCVSAMAEALPAPRAAVGLEHGPGQPPTACGRTFTSEAFVGPLLDAG